MKYELSKEFQGKHPDQEIQLIAFSGTSMLPTLQEYDLLEVRPYHNRIICRGDVIYFTHPGKVPPMVHRVIGFTGEGLRTQGDNNPVADEYVLRQEQVVGKVTAVSRGIRRCKIMGGWRGHILGMILHGLHWLDTKIAPKLSRMYHLISNNGFLFRIMPRSLRPKIIQIQVGGQTCLFLFWCGIVIGKFSNSEGRWIIRRPFRLIIDNGFLDSLKMSKTG